MLHPSLTSAVSASRSTVISMSSAFVAMNSARRSGEALSLTGVAARGCKGQQRAERGGSMGMQRAAAGREGGERRRGGGEAQSKGWEDNRS